MPRVINIASNSEDKEGRILTYMYPSGFSLLYKGYAEHFSSMESFFHACKYPVGSNERGLIARSDPFEARKLRPKNSPGWWFWGFVGKRFLRNAPAGDYLQFAALCSRFNQNPEDREILLSTGDATFTHEVIIKNDQGEMIPMQHSTNFDPDKFCAMFMVIRSEYQKGNYILSPDEAKSILQASDHWRWGNELNC